MPILDPVRFKKYDQRRFYNWRDIGGLIEAVEVLTSTLREISKNMIEGKE